MLGFGKKSPKDEEEEPKKKRRRRDIDGELEDLKDLKSKNKNKRKEPLKPWGKGERILVLTVVFGTAAVAGVLGLSSRSWKLPGIPRLNTPQLNLERTHVLEADETNDEVASTVISQFLDQTQNLSGVYGLYVARLYEDESYGVLEDEQFTAASLMKLPVMVALCIETEEGNIRSLKYEGLVEKMGKSSDNKAYLEAIDLVGEDRIQEIIEEIGMSKTSLANNLTTPADMGKLLRKLWERRLLNDSNTSLIFDSLTDTDYEDHLSAGIPEDIQVAHKYGEDIHIVNDAGIVFANKQPLIIVLMSKGVVETETTEAFPAISQLIYNAEND